MKFLIIIIYLITTGFGYAIDKPDIKNLVLIENSKIYEEVIFKDKNQKNVNLNDYKGKLVILNFWATWCAPCREEMPSLDNLQFNQKLGNLKVFPINIGKENKIKVNKFFEDFNIKNFEPYFDPPITLAKKFSLRGVPTSIIIDKNGQEFARIIGSINFDSNNFIDWLKDYN